MGTKQNPSPTYGMCSAPSYHHVGMARNLLLGYELALSVIPPKLDLAGPRIVIVQGNTFSSHRPGNTKLGRLRSGGSVHKTRRSAGGTPQDPH